MENRFFLFEGLAFKIFEYETVLIFSFRNNSHLILLIIFLYSITEHFSSLEAEKLALS